MNLDCFLYVLICFYLFFLSGLCLRCRSSEFLGSIGFCKQQGS